MIKYEELTDADFWNITALPKDLVNLLEHIQNQKLRRLLDEIFNKYPNIREEYFDKAEKITKELFIIKYNIHKQIDKYRQENNDES